MSDCVVFCHSPLLPGDALWRKTRLYPRRDAIVFRRMACERHLQVYRKASSGELSHWVQEHRAFIEPYIDFD